MRPGQLTPENDGAPVKIDANGSASMRPGQLTPENGETQEQADNRAFTLQ